jgi:hypothetical protein
MGAAQRLNMIRQRECFVVFAGRGQSAPNAFPTILGNPIAAVTAPITSNS